jgi:2-polyprenyl-6-methoxyphenol hydroxylase-like FAD-dependent oxidoreductase
MATTALPRTAPKNALTRGSAIVVGASLSGLLTAVSLAYAGFGVTVLERARRQGIAGAALRVTPSRTGHTTRSDGTGRRVPTLRMIASGGEDRAVESWSVIHSRLRAAAALEPRISLREGVGAAEAGQDLDFAWVRLTTGDTLRADVVVGADGYRSVVRRSVAPEHPEARYAGYLLWVGRIPESTLPPELWLPGGDNGVMEYGRDILFAYALPGEDGSMTPGERDLGFAIYDAARNATLRRLGVVEGSVVQRSLRGPDIPDETLQQVLRGLDQWPQEWADVIREAMRRRAVVGTPIAEYVPLRLASGRLALVGNAAHVPTPMTGSGFDASLADAEALGEAMSRVESPDDVPAALADYEASRLPEARRLVESGQSFSRSFARA